MGSLRYMYKKLSCILVNAFILIIFLTFTFDFKQPKNETLRLATKKVNEETFTLPRQTTQSSPEYKTQTTSSSFKWPIYFLFTRKNLFKSFNLNSANLINSHFNFSLRTYLIIHGFSSNSNRTWIKNIKDNILAIETVNVIVVDWSGASNDTKSDESFSIDRLNPNEYIEATENVKILGRRVVKLILQANLNHQKIHCIGHSLGAHGKFSLRTVVDKNQAGKK
jgi:pimeloyl-ACP methyl ester carboxylesterase